MSPEGEKMNLPPFGLALIAIALTPSLAFLPTASAWKMPENCTREGADVEHSDGSHDYWWSEHCMVRKDGIDCTEGASGHYNDANRPSSGSYSNSCKYSFPTAAG